MKIDYLKVQNFMLYRKGKWSFRDKDVIGILCEYASNPEKSNRGGKTTILEAMKYALTGKTRAKTKTQLIHIGEEVMMVELGLIDNEGTKYKIRRGIDYKNHALLECDWIDKSREAQKAINELIGCDAKEFELTNYFRKKETGGFMELSPPEKQKYMMKWFNNTHWIELYKTVSADLSEKLNKISKLRTRKEAFGEDVGNSKKISKRIKELKAKIELKELSLKDIRSKRRNLESKQVSEDELEDLIDQRDSTDEELRDIEHSLDTQEESKEKIIEWGEKLSLLKKKKKKLGKYNQIQYKSLIELRYNSANERHDIKDKLETVEEDFCGICPVLNEGCDRIKKDPKQIKSWKREVKELANACQEYSAKITQMEQAKLVKDQIKTAENKVIQLKKGLTSTKSLEKKKAALQAKFESLTADINKGQDAGLDDKLEAIKIKITKRKLGLDGLNQKLGQYQSNLVRIKEAKSKISKIDESILELDKEVKDLKYLAFMFGKSGIPSQEIENCFQDIEDEVNFILERFNDGVEISFNADKETTKWEEDCVGCGWRFPKGYRQKDCQECGEERLKKRKDEVYLSVLEHGNETSFDMESDGGMFFISFAVRIALTMLKQRQTGSQFRVLFLDEIDASLDKDARKQLMKLITTILIKQFGFQQVFWVSHFTEIQNSVPHTLKVLRKKKYAKARWV